MRCGNCGSKEVSLITDSSYSYKKGMIGAAVMGPVGAVAGINGNSSMKYHCMRCGQNALTIMADYRERMIDEAIQNGDAETLDRLRITWPNIEYIDHAKTESKTYGESVARQDDIDYTEISEEELAQILKEDISNSRIPYEVSELVDKYDYHTYDALDILRKKGIIRYIRKERLEYVECATTVDEINQFILINAAEDRRDIEDNVGEIIQKIVRDNPGIVFEEITQLLENQHPEYAIKNNPYAYSALVDTRISNLLYSFDLICDKGGYFAPSDVEREKMLKTEAEKRVKDFGKRYDEGIVNELISVMSANPYEIKVHDIISSNPKLKDASLAGRSIGRNMAYLIRHGMVEERAKGYIINSKYMNYHVSFDDIFSLHEENYGSFIISTLSEHKEEKMSLNLISELADKKLGELKEKALDREEKIKLINLRKDDVNLYVELCHYREQGILENESDDISSLWKYVG